MSELLENFNRLSEEQQETITYLIGEIADGDVSPANVATRDAARIVLSRFEGASEKLTAEECAAEFRRYEINVVFDMTPDSYPDGLNTYVVSKTWTLKGLRHALARQHFLESITCNVTGEGLTD